jgi:hypothetical protein
VHACALPAWCGEVVEPGSPVRWNNSGAIRLYRFFASSSRVSFGFPYNNGATSLVHVASPQSHIPMLTTLSSLIGKCRRTLLGLRSLCNIFNTHSSHDVHQCPSQVYMFLSIQHQSLPCFIIWAWAAKKFTFMLILFVFPIIMAHGKEGPTIPP